MAQKKKQTRKAPAATRAVVVENDVEGLPAVQATGLSSTSRSFSSEFNPDYSQTIKDLKRIAILAGTFFTLLIILAFVLP